MIKQVAKKHNLRKQFELSKTNIKATWKLIGSLVNGKNSTSQNKIKKVLRNNKLFTVNEIYAII